MKHLHHRNQGSAMVGIILIVIGSLFILQNLHVIYVGSVWSHWPIIFVIIGAVKITQSENKKEFGEAVWWLFLGTWLYISIRNIYGLDFSDTWPALLVAWGISIIWKSFVQQSYRLVKE